MDWLTIVRYWQESYARTRAWVRRLEEEALKLSGEADYYRERTDLLRGALIVIDAQVWQLAGLPWWRRRKRRLAFDTIRDTLELVGVEQGMRTEGKLTP